MTCFCKGDLQYFLSNLVMKAQSTLKKSLQRSNALPGHETKHNDKFLTNSRLMPYCVLRTVLDKKKNKTPVEKPKNAYQGRQTKSVLGPRAVSTLGTFTKSSPSQFLWWDFQLTMASKASSSLFQSLRRYIKKPWEITGPCADPEYKNAVPKATEYRVRCPATTLQKPIVPTSDPETVFDIKYYSRDQRRNRPPIRRTILKKDDVVKMMREKTFDVNDFPKVYLTAKVEEDENAVGGGYQK